MSDASDLVKLQNEAIKTLSDKMFAVELSLLAIRHSLPQQDAFERSSKEVLNLLNERKGLDGLTEGVISHYRRMVGIKDEADE